MSPKSASCLLLAALLLPAQEVTFRTGTKLVEVQVVVTGRDGKPVTNLTKEDFSILDEGTSRDLAFFAPPLATLPPAKPPLPLPPGIFSNRAEYAPAAPQSVTCLLIDDYNTRTSDRMFVHAQVLQFLRTYDGRDPIAIYLLSDRLSIVHDFTTDPAGLIAKIKQLGPGTTAGGAEAEAGFARDAAAMQRVLDEARGEFSEPSNELSQIQIEQRVRFTIRSMEFIARRLAGVPGRKNLLWMGGGLPAGVRTGMGGIAGSVSPAVRSFQDLYEQAVRVLVDSSVAVYPVDAKGLEAWDPSMASGSLSAGYGGGRMAGMRARSAMVDSLAQDTLSTMHRLADNTGGTITRNTNDLTIGVRHALDDARNSYTLAFYATDTGTRARNIQVKLRPSGLSARHRKSYYPDSSSKAEKLDSHAVQEILSSPVAPTSIQLNTRVLRDGSRYKVLLQIDTGSLALERQGSDTAGNLSLWFALKLADGRISTTAGRLPFRLDEAKMAKAIKSGLTFSQDLPAGNNAIGIRILVRDDNSGATGVVDVPVSSIPTAEAQ